MMCKVDRYIDKQMMSNFTAWLLQIGIKMLLKEISRERTIYIYVYIFTLL